MLPEQALREFDECCDECWAILDEIIDVQDLKTIRSAWYKSLAAHQLAMSFRMKALLPIVKQYYGPPI
jgi:hypothetical protein